MTGPPISLCMINYNGAHHLAATFAAIAEQDWPFAEIVVVDDASDDDSVEVVEALCPTARVIKLDVNRGPGAARNIAFAAAAHELILFLDNDVRLQPDTVQALFAVLRDKPDALLVTPRTLYEREPARIQYESANCHFLGMMAPRHADRRSAGTSGGRIATSSMISCCFLLDRARWSAKTLFDESFGFNLEDHDFGIRARLLGHELWVEPAAHILHGGGSDGLSYRPGDVASVDRIFYLLRNRWYILTKCFSLRTLLLLVPVLVPFELAQMLALASRGRAGTWWRSVTSFAAGWRMLLSKRRDIQQTRQLPDGAILRGGPLPFTPWVKAGRGTRLGVSLFECGANFYWRLVRPLI